MRKILILFLGALMTACTPHDAVDEMYYPISTAPETVSTPVQHGQKVQPLATNSRTFNPNKTYMAELAKKLKKAAGTSGITVKQQGPKIVVTFPNDVVFGSNQTALDRQVEPIIAEMSRALKDYDSVKIQVFGYTDDVGTVSVNRAYSLKQANSIANFLRLNGIDVNRIVVDGLGAENPIANNKTEANRRRNRRVEMTLINMQ